MALVLLSSASHAESVTALIQRIPHPVLDMVVGLLALTIPILWLVATWQRSRRELPYRAMLANLGPRLGAGLLKTDGTVIEVAGVLWGAASQLRMLVGRPLWHAEIFAGDAEARKRLEQSVAQAARGEPLSCEVSARTSAGEQRTIEVSLRPLRRSHRQIDRLVVSLFDASERKAAELSLAAQVQQRERLLDNSPLALSEWDAELRVRRWSRQAEELFGWKQDEAIGRSSTELGMVPMYDNGADKQRSPLMLDAMLQPMRRCRRKDGREFWIESYNSVLRGADGEVNTIQTLSRDVTDKRKILLKALENESRFRNIFHGAAVGMALLDDDGRWLTVNRRLCELTGYSEAELLTMDLAALTHHDERAAAVEPLRQLLSGSNDEARVERRLLRKDGGVIRTLLHLHHVEATDDTPDALVAAIEDIGDRKADEEQAARHIATLEARVEARNEQLQQMMGFARRRADDLALASELTSLLPTAHDLPEAARVIGRYLPQLFPEAWGAVYFEGAEPGRYQLQVQWGPPAEFVQEFVLADCWATRRGHEHRVEDPMDPMRCTHLVENDRDHSYACLPLIAQGGGAPGAPIGVLELHWGSIADGMTPDSVLLRSLAGQIGLAIGNMKLRDDLSRQAFCDPLTGLYSRRTVDDFLRRRHAHWRRHGQAYSLLMVDLDNLTTINTEFGYEAGDQLLREVAALLRRVIRVNEAVFRFGGEEFLLIIDTATPEDAVRCAERVRREVEGYRMAGSGRALPSVTVSVGVASCPIDGDEPPDLLEESDEALRAAKAGGRNRVCRFRLYVGTGMGAGSGPDTGNGTGDGAETAIESSSRSV
jgi:diguanylate cyclase (GGDEF)-like protein/PAS domain S-box-containing protein